MVGWAVVDDGCAALVEWVGRQWYCKGPIWDLERRVVELPWYGLHDKSSLSSCLQNVGRYSPLSRLERSQPPPHRMGVGHVRDTMTHGESRVTLSLKRGRKIAEHSFARREFLARRTRRWGLGHTVMIQDYSWLLPLASLVPFRSCRLSARAELG